MDLRGFRTTAVATRVSYVWEELLETVALANEGPVHPADYIRICQDIRLCDLSREIMRRAETDPDRWKSKPFWPDVTEWAADLGADDRERIAASIQPN